MPKTKTKKQRLGSFPLFLDFLWGFDDENNVASVHSHILNGEQHLLVHQFMIASLEKLLHTSPKSVGFFFQAKSRIANQIQQSKSIVRIPMAQKVISSTTSPLRQPIRYYDNSSHEEHENGSLPSDDALRKAPSAAIIAVSPSGSVTNKPKTWASAKSSFWLSRIVILRALAFVHFFSFLGSFNQLPSLVGFDGLLPAHLHLSKLKRHPSHTYLDLNIFWLFEDILPTENSPLFLVPSPPTFLLLLLSFHFFFSSFVLTFSF